jgi:DNA-binding IclR family transcriptional regulator
MESVAQATSNDSQPNSQHARDGAGLRTLERGLAVLELLGTAESGYPVSEVAQRLGLPMGTTHRLLQTLLHTGYVEQDPRTRRYQLGLKILELRGVTVGAMRMAAEARPFLRDLMLRTGLRVHLAVYRGGSVVYIDRVDNPASLLQYVPLGKRAAAHATGLGKAILAHSAAEDIAAFLGRQPLTRITAATITDADALRRELAAVRYQGFALDHGESEINTRCVAAPIFDYTGRVVAAVSIAGERAEVEPRVAELAPVVMEIAQAVSRRFGYRPAEELTQAEGVLAAAWTGAPATGPRAGVNQEELP